MTKEEAIWILENRTVTGELKPRVGGYTDLYDFCLEALKQISAQPEIIRCKDCKWFNNAGCAIEIVDELDNPTENDFCSFAERKEDE